MRVLITGDKGFVGSHLRAAFEQRGDQVVGVDLADGLDALDFFRSPWVDGIDLALHCAATIGGRAGIDGSPLAVATNMSLDSWFFWWLLSAQVPRAVYFSSSAAYPVDLQRDFATARRLREEDISLKQFNVGRPDATYGWAKLSGEQLAQVARENGCGVLTVRPFSGYGPGQSLDYPFPALIRRAVRREDPFEVWGDGSAVRDWVHIDDIVGAVLALADGPWIGPMNIGTGVGTSFAALAALILEQAGAPERPVRFLPGMPSGVAYRVADVSRLSQWYAPKVSLEEGIRRAVEAAGG